MEKDLVGLYLSGHPLESVRKTLERQCSATAATFRDLENDEECTIGGIIADVRYRITRRNDKMGFIKLEDLTGTIPVTFFPQSLKACEQQLVKDKIVLIKGKACHRGRIAAEEDDATVEVEIRGEVVTPMRNGDAHEAGRPRSVHIRINGTPGVRLDFLRRLLESSPGESPVYFHMVQGQARQKVATSYKVEPTAEFVSQIERILGKEVVKVG